MNRFFDPSEYRRDFPRRAYARLDDLEPIVRGPNDALTFVLDAVDADWKGFGSGGVFDFSNPNLEKEISGHWNGEPFDGPDGYDEIPVYRIELTLGPGHNMFDLLPQEEEPWVTLELTEEPTDTPVDVYGGLFGPPVKAFLNGVRRSVSSDLLSVIFDMETWPDSSQTKLKQALKQQCNLDALVCFDIGQGSATALVCSCGAPIYYFDVGRGSGRNAKTAPSLIDFCTCLSPTIVLSHWDTDHWAGAAGHRGLLSQTWIVPRQTISSTHMVFANDILSAGGTILVVGLSAPALIWSNAHQDYDLRRCTGKGRNGTGLALVVTDRCSGRAWVLPGDAGYHELPHPTPGNVAAMLAPHHGADMGPSSKPYPRSSFAYARLFYSFGPDNRHGPGKPGVQHPTAAATSAHSGVGWGHGSWSSMSPASTLAGSDVLATATHPTTHLQGGVAGWNRPPSLGHLSSCPNAMPVPQT
jgi:hypothetical protein